MKMRRSNLINDPLWEWVLSPRYGTSSHFQTPRNRMDGRGQERAHKVWSLRNEVTNRAKSREKIRKADSTMWDQAGKTERYRGIYVISKISSAVVITRYLQQQYLSVVDTYVNTAENFGLYKLTQF